MIVAPPTVVNPIEDALAPFGVRIYEQHLPPRASWSSSRRPTARGRPVPPSRTTRLTRHRTMPTV